ncbi:AsnC family transcriptional regulator [Phytohabitans flavus]|uniref:AsnC family transcriptional regulator n=1 Tax=Phytohabitans flavus TaxID=1076124 RepID=A0A6F8XIT2_9ACTN|nr:AsnC family transcriptional regulator [Phytohabitans flavus]BCB73724.1 AsnC family transcriptional regulator [Phytohabitans flavus]
MDSVTVDPLDRALIHALQIDGRAPFSQIGAVLGVSDQTIARRYRRMRAAGVVRVIGQTNVWRSGEVRWYIRIHCTPDAASAVAEAVARRPDTFWVNLMSGGTEVNCVTQVRSADERDALLLRKLPRTPRVVGVSAHCLLHLYFGGASEHPAVADALTPAQVAALTTDLPRRDEPVTLSAEDRILIDTLGKDGRASYGELAAATGWSESTAKRRLRYLHEAGIVFFDLDLDPHPLGFDTQAILWLSVPPSELDAVGRAVAAHPEVAFAAATTGQTNLVATVVCRNVQALYRYLTERLGALTAIRHVETAPIIRIVKAAGASRPSGPL